MIPFTPESTKKKVKLTCRTLKEKNCKKGILLPPLNSYNIQSCI